MVDATFPLKLDNTRNMEAFFIGIEDKRVRDGLRQQKNAPKELLEIVDLVEDPKFLQMASSVVEKLRGPGIKSVTRADSPIKLTAPTVAPNLDDTNAAAIRSESAALNAYIEKKYPNGQALLAKYAQASLGQPTVYGWTAAYTNAVANAQAIANAAVYANVAVATMAVVAAAVVAVIAAAVAM
jgi:hypothetical protein